MKRDITISHAACLEIEKRLMESIACSRKALNAIQTIRMSQLSLSPFSQGWKENQPKEIPINLP